MSPDSIHFDEIFSKYRSDPYNYVDMYAIHAGTVRFIVEKEEEVLGVSGAWNHVPGTPLYEITRERNPKLITSKTNGTVSYLDRELDNQFVEAGTRLMTIRHPLKKKEVIEAILQEVLYLFPAPERARYFFSMDIQAKIEQKGIRSIFISPGDEIITMSLMKRDTPVYYDGEAGILHSVYFDPGESVNKGVALIGVCPEERVAVVQKIIDRVKAEWES